jgi:hypothetical protein
MKVAINGFGRIGRSVFRILDQRPDVEVVAINDLSEADGLLYLLRHDTVMGEFKGNPVLEDGHLITAHGRTRMLCEKDPAALPWQELAVDVVIEATGKFRKRAQIMQHIEAGAQRVILTVPAKDDIDCTVVLGVNDEVLQPGHRIISNASCTTNCLAPVVKVLNDNFGIVEGIINTVHAYTNDQRLADVPHTDWRRSRAAAEKHHPDLHRSGQGRGPGAAGPERPFRRHRLACAGSGRLGGGPVCRTGARCNRRGRARGNAAGGGLGSVARHPAVHRGGGGVFRHHRQPALLDFRCRLHAGARRALPQVPELVRQRVGLFPAHLRSARHHRALGLKRAGAGISAGIGFGTGADAQQGTECVARVAAGEDAVDLADHRHIDAHAFGQRHDHRRAVHAPRPPCACC